MALGIESGDKAIRLEVSKCKFEDVDVKKVISKVHDADINVMANYIYGLPGDTKETIKKLNEKNIKSFLVGESLIKHSDPGLLLESLIG